MRKRPPSDCNVGGEEPDFPKKGKNNPRPTLAHAKATWACEVPLATYILSFIKFYPALIPPNPCNFYSTYPVINPETGVSPAATTNY
jgi:hypothetical protein